MFSAMPTTYVHGIVSALTRMHWPIASLARPERLRHRLAHDHNARRVRRVLRRDAAAANDARAHRREIVGRHRVQVELAEPAHRVDAFDIETDAPRASRTASVACRLAFSTPGMCRRRSSSRLRSSIVCALSSFTPRMFKFDRSAPDRRRSPGAPTARCADCARTARRRRAARPTARPGARAARRALRDRWNVPSRAPALRSPVRSARRACNTGASPVSTPTTSAAATGEQHRSRIAEHGRRLRSVGRGAPAAPRRPIARRASPARPPSEGEQQLSVSSCDSSRAAAHAERESHARSRAAGEARARAAGSRRWRRR